MEAERLEDGIDVAAIRRRISPELRPLFDSAGDAKLIAKYIFAIFYYDKPVMMSPGYNSNFSKAVEEIRRQTETRRFQELKLYTVGNRERSEEEAAKSVERMLARLRNDIISKGGKVPDPYPQIEFEEGSRVNVDGRLKGMIRDMDRDNAPTTDAQGSA